MNFDPSPYIRVVFIAITGHILLYYACDRTTLCYTCIDYCVNSYIFSLLLLCCCGCCLPSEQRRQHHSPSGCVSTPTQLLQRKKSEGLLITRPYQHTSNHHDRLCTYQWYHLLHSSHAIMFFWEVICLHWPHFQSSFIIFTTKQKGRLNYLYYNVIFCYIYLFVQLPSMCLLLSIA